MKKAIFIAVLFISTLAYSQVATYEQVSTKKAKGKLTEYISKDGTSFKVGDTIVVGQPKNGSYSTMQAAYGYVGSEPIQGMELEVTKMKIFKKQIWVHAKGIDYKIGESRLELMLMNNEIVKK